MTIKVRDKIIEQFANQPLDEINNSLKKLLANEEDEQKRLGVLAARVFILRQRIVGLSGNTAKPVLSAKSPKTADLAAGGEAPDTEWTRLRIIKDCEVNGVRFPKSFVIDVKSGDALKLIEAGNAERVDASEAEPASPITSDTESASAAEIPDEADTSQDTAMVLDDDLAETAAEMHDVSLDSEPATEVSVEAEAESDDADADDSETDFIAQLAAQEIPEDDDPDSVDLSESDLALDGDITAAAALAPADEAETPQSAEAEPENKAETVPVIEAPSAEDVTAALEALGASDDDTTAGELAVPVAADGDALSGDANAGDAEPENSDDDAEPGDADAGDANSLAAATAIKPDEIAALLGETVAKTDADKPASWFEAQQNAEAKDRDDASEGDTTKEEDDSEPR
jgi:hypothetical protein